MESLKNLSIYDIRKAARQAQNSLFTSKDTTDFEITLRKITTNDPWGPSTKELNELLDLTLNPDYNHNENLDMQLNYIIQRIIKYLNPNVGSSKIGQAPSISSKIYDAAVKYVNQGSEWRIISKCLRVLEFFLLNSTETERVVRDLKSNELVFERILVKYSQLIKEGQDAQNIASKETETVITSNVLENIETYKVLVKQTQDLLKLIKDDTFRSQEITKTLKLAGKMGSISNEPEVVEEFYKDKTPAFYKNFKSKNLDRSKITHSNIKSEIRNKYSHGVRQREHLPGLYSPFNETNSDNKLFDDDSDRDDDYEYNDFHDDINDRGNNHNEFNDDERTYNDPVNDGKDSISNNSNNYDKNNNEEDDFGDFQTSPTKPIEELLSFDTDDAPGSNIGTLNSFLSTPTIKTTISTFTTPNVGTEGTASSTTTPTTSNVDKYSFADLFQNAKK